MNETRQGWKWTQGRTIYEIVRGVSYKKQDAQMSPQTGLVPVLRANNIQNGRIIADDIVWVPASYVSSEQYLKAGDILIATSSGSRHIVGKTAIVRAENSQFAFGAFCAVARPLYKSGGNWIYYFSSSRAYRDYVEEVALGININNFRTSDLGILPVPLPPLAEQQRIVAKLDAFFARTRQAREELEHIPTLIEHYKQAILAAAFRGELTADWREQTDSEAVWSEKTIGQIADVGTGATPKRGTAKYYDNGTIPWVTSSTVNLEIIDQAEEYITEVALKETNCKVFPSGTIVMAMYGEGKTRGKVSVLGIDAATNQALAAIQVNDETQIVRKYLLWFLHSIYLDIRRKAAGGVQPNLNLTIVRSITVPIPSPEEQIVIVEQVSEAFEWLDIVLDEATSALSLLDHLDQATLSKAFRGELVPQNPDDEPASVLLERIRAARAEQSNGSRRQKRK